MPWCFSDGSFPSPCWKYKKIFPWHLLWGSGVAAGGKPHNIVGVCYSWVTPEFLTLRVVCTEPPAMHQLTFRFSYPDPGSYRGFCLRVSAAVITDDFIVPHVSPILMTFNPCLPCVCNQTGVCCPMHTISQTWDPGFCKGKSFIARQPSKETGG